MSTRPRDEKTGSERGKIAYLSYSSSSPSPSSSSSLSISRLGCVPSSSRQLRGARNLYDVRKGLEEGYADQIPLLVSISLSLGMTEQAFGFRVPGSGFQVPGSGLRVPDSEFTLPASRFRVPVSRLTSRRAGGSQPVRCSKRP